ncbi:hypothetical protein LY78DRAFT_725289 [Colletotrichum sublineola]|uniref:BTB domain-containing protein n=1 Tax=Colletotrichum sublineola TaxID=1173701 RepID=A0A066X561_COLSU|nr:hypothetical protein LY78DRAFT_725289 [Colletotrichum sublineola]KDN64092.1 hypothetical protein CSUB01_05110 [Colletotrichum sublineola]
MSPTVEQKVMETIAQSRIIQFIIGDDLTVFNVHEASIWGLSKLLDKELWRQTGDYKVTWKYVDVGTFATFLEYAYTGNFTVIDRGLKHKLDNEEPPSLGEYMASCELNDSESVKYALKHFGQVLQQPCCKNNAGQASTLARRNGPSYSRHYYLAHSRLYIFADNYGLEKLRSLCIEKMRQSLVGNSGQVQLIHAVVDVLRFI